MAIKIEENVPVPTKRLRVGKTESFTQRVLRMLPKQSFVVPRDEAVKTRARLSSTKRFYKEFDYVTESQPDGTLRVWRVNPIV